ncbi:O-antigen ligase family protein [Bdellovibrionales bacterium]|nr:O-antigen ligase family protein [Bdellovibrionales bacterium]
MICTLNMHTLPRLELLLKVAATLFLLICCYAVVQSFTGVHFFKDVYLQTNVTKTVFFRAKGFFSNTMTFSHTYSMWVTLFFASYFLKYHKHDKYRLFYNSTPFLGAVTIFFTLTRGAWIAMIGAVLTQALIYKREVFFKLITLFSLGIIGASIVSKPWRHRFLNIFNLGANSNSERIEIWRANLEMFFSHPWAGIGYGKNIEKINEYYQLLEIKNGFVGHAHNSYLQILGGSGIVGFILFYAFSFLVLYRTLLLYREIESSSLEEKLTFQVALLGSLGAQISFHLSGLTESVISDIEVVYNFIFFLSLYFGVRDTLQRKRLHLVLNKKGELSSQN